MSLLTTNLVHRPVNMGSRRARLLEGLNSSTRTILPSPSRYKIVVGKPLIVLKTSLRTIRLLYGLHVLLMNVSGVGDPAEVWRDHREEEDLRWRACVLVVAQLSDRLDLGHRLGVRVQVPSKR
jgi:hypothetical protein